MSRSQALAAGLTTRQLELRAASCSWVRLYPGVYALPGAPRTWRQRLKAALLWAGGGAVVSHRAAAALWGFARYREGPVELSTARDLRPARPTVVHRVGALRAREVVVIDGLRVTSAARTLLDLSGVDEDRAVRASLDEALRRKWTTLDELQVAVERARSSRGLALVRSVVEELLGGEAPTESELEARVVDLLDAEGLPRPSRQVPVVVGGKLRRLDFHFAGTRVVIEADGYASHSSAEVFERDRDRNNRLIARGFLVLHWTWAALHERPDELVAQLRRTFDACGLRSSGRLELGDGVIGDGAAQRRRLTPSR